MTNAPKVGDIITLTGEEISWESRKLLCDYYGDTLFPTQAVLMSIVADEDCDGDPFYEFKRVPLLEKNCNIYYVSSQDWSQAETDSETISPPPVPDMVNHPPHYNGHPTGIECIEVIEHNPFLNLGNAMKYLWRVSWGSKGRDDEDLAKAIWFIERERKRRAAEAQND